MMEIVQIMHASKKSTLLFKGGRIMHLIVSLVSFNMIILYFLIKILNKA